MYTANDAIGKVYIRLDSLTGGVAGGVARGVDTLDGWFPIFDTLHGIRGEVHVIVKVEVVADQHPLKQSSHGVAIFTCESLSHSLGLLVMCVCGQVPVYQWGMVWLHCMALLRSWWSMTTLSIRYLHTSHTLTHLTLPYSGLTRYVHLEHPMKHVRDSSQSCQVLLILCTGN